jgi:hypothetical protein
MHPLLSGESLDELFVPSPHAFLPLAQALVIAVVAHLASLAGDMPIDARRPVPRSHRERLRNVLRSLSVTADAGSATQGLHRPTEVRLLGLLRDFPLGRTVAPVGLTDEPRAGGSSPHHPELPALSLARGLRGRTEPHTALHTVIRQPAQAEGPQPSRRVRMTPARTATNYG